MRGNVNVLLSAVGRRAYLVDYFKNVVHPLGGKVYATNTTSDATGFLAADIAKIVSPASSVGYIEEMLALCREWNIKLLFSLHDWDAPALARSRQRFVEQGTILVMGSPNLLATCLDKFATFEAIHGLGIRTPRTVLSIEEALVQLKFPMIVKPRWGQGSVGLFKVEDEEELKSAVFLSTLKARCFACACSEIDVGQPQVIIQECIIGPEYGCDIINDLTGRFRHAFVKHKFAMRSGETDAAESVLFPEIEQKAQLIGEWSKHLGCMDSDWMLHEDGHPYLIELNPRFGGGYPFTHCAGANVPSACVSWVQGYDEDNWWKNYRPGVRTFKDISLVSISHCRDFVR